MKRFNIAALAFFGFALAFAAGCMTDAEIRQRRIEQNIVLFSQLPPDAQQRVSVGSIAVGDTQAAVWLAWGEPNAKSYGANANGSFEVWQYTKTVSEPYQVLVYDPPPPPPPPGHHRHHPPRFQSYHYETQYRYVRVPARQVDFYNGIVTQVQLF